jgi:hypothetical protein
MLRGPAHDEAVQGLQLHADRQPLAIGAPITYDLTTGAIGAFELLQWVVLAAVLRASGRGTFAGRQVPYGPAWPRAAG